MFSPGVRVRVWFPPSASIWFDTHEHDGPKPETCTHAPSSSSVGIRYLPDQASTWRLCHPNTMVKAPLFAAAEAAEPPSSRWNTPAKYYVYEMFPFCIQFQRLPKQKENTPQAGRARQIKLAHHATVSRWEGIRISSTCNDLNLQHPHS